MNKTKKVIILREINIKRRYNIYTFSTILNFQFSYK